MKRRKPRAKKLPEIRRQPKVDPKHQNPLDQNPSWHINKIDMHGKWGWANVTHNEIVNNILSKMGNFEKMKWNEILGSNSHEVKSELVCRDAQKRLSELRLDDIESLISFRLTGRQRVWGIRINSVLNLLWWDPEHTVYPSQKRNT